MSRMAGDSLEPLVPCTPTELHEEMLDAGHSQPMALFAPGTTFSTVSWCLLGTVREHAPAHSRFTQSCSRTPRHSHSNRDTGRSSAEGRGSSTGAGVESSRHPLHGTHTRHTRDTRAHGSHRRTSQPSQTIPNHQRTHSLSGVCPGSPGVFLPVQYRYRVCPGSPRCLFTGTFYCTSFASFEFSLCAVTTRRRPPCVSLQPWLLAMCCWI
jgi:hypothetical protein